MKPAALAIVERRKNEILLVLRRDVPVWVLPGGGIDDNESLEHAALRETWEETSLHIADIHLQAIYRPCSSCAAPTYVFHARANSFSEKVAPDIWHEVRAFRFFTLDTLPSNLFFMHKNILMEWEKNPEGGIDRPLVEISYITAVKMFISHPWYSLRYLVTRLLQT